MAICVRCDSMMVEVPDKPHKRRCTLCGFEENAHFSEGDRCFICGKAEGSAIWYEVKGWGLRRICCECVEKRVNAVGENKYD